MEFEVACQSELDKKLREHKCQLITGKVERTVQLQQSLMDCFVHDTAVNRIEEHNFDELIKQGMIV